MHIFFAPKSVLLIYSESVSFPVAQSWAASCSPPEARHRSHKPCETCQLVIRPASGNHGLLHRSSDRGVNFCVHFNIIQSVSMERRTRSYIPEAVRNVRRAGLVVCDFGNLKRESFLEECGLDPHGGTEAVYTSTCLVIRLRALRTERMWHSVLLLCVHNESSPFRV